MNSGHTANKPTYYLLDCCDFIIMKLYEYESHTYIIVHYNPSVRIIDLVSHTTYVVYVSFIDKWRDLQFEVDSEWQIFWETFHANFIYSQSTYKSML